MPSERAEEVRVVAASCGREGDARPLDLLPVAGLDEDGPQLVVQPPGVARRGRGEAGDQVAVDLARAALAEEPEHAAPRAAAGLVREPDQRRHGLDADVRLGPVERRQHDRGRARVADLAERAHHARDGLGVRLHHLDQPRHGLLAADLAECVHGALADPPVRILGGLEQVGERAFVLGLVQDLDGGAADLLVLVGDERERRADRAADQRQHDALRQQLPHEAPATRTDSGSNRHLLPARSRSRQQQIGDVRTRDEQHKRDGAEDDPECATGINHEDLQQRS